MSLSLLLAHLLPKRCLGCGALTIDEDFCATCTSTFRPPQHAGNCLACGRPTTADHTLGDVGRCPLWQRCAPLLPAAAYQGKIAALLRHVKAASDATALPALAHLAWDALDPGQRHFLAKADALLPVPLHPRVLRRRGFNQAALIARPLARRLALPLMPTALLRTRNSAAQKTLSVAQREQNVRNLFRAHGLRHGTRVVLVDDVSTSGATLRACVAALTQAGVTTVAALTIAQAELDSATHREA